MDYEKKYKKALKRAKEFYILCKKCGAKGTVDFLENTFPELQESEDETVRKELITHCKNTKCVTEEGAERIAKWIAWLEKQGEQKIDDDDKAILENWEGIVKDNKEKWQLSDWFVEATLLLVQKIKRIGLSKPIVDNNKIMLNACINTLRNIGHSHLAAWLEKQGGITKLSEEEQNKFAKGVLTRCALSFIDYLDAHKYEGKMCVSNGECEDIENAFHNAMWDRLHRYYCKFIKNQSRQETTDNVEPKFHEGTWVMTDKNNVVKIRTIEDNKYVLENTMKFSVDYVDKCWRKWDISDAKDGDVLVSKHNQPFIYNGIFDEESVGAYCGIDCLGDDFLESTFSCNWSYKEGVKPATKEQCDLLFQKMKEAGYEWDAEKKELKLLITNGGDFFESENCEQKHVEWSEEDKRICNNIINDITNDKSICKYEIAKGICDEQINWLKSLKERMADNHPNLTWEDIRKIYLIAKNVHKYYGFWTQNIYEEILDRFNKPEVWT